MASFVTSSNGIYAKLVVTEQSQSVANNTTTLLWEIYMWNTTAKPNWYMYDQHNIFQVKINGEYVFNNSDFGRVSLQYEQPESAARLITSGTYTIAHNSDGTKTGVPVYLYAAQGWEYAYVWETSGTMNLTTIARASTPTLSASSATLGGSVRIYTNWASSAFTHILKYSIGSISEYTFATGVGEYYDWSPPKDLAYQFPNKPSGLVTIACETYNGDGSHIGTDYTYLTVNISDDMVPSMSYSITEANDSVKSFGIYIQSLSKLYIHVGADGCYGSTIDRYEIKANGATYNDHTITTGYLNTAGTNTVTMTVWDTRGKFKTAEYPITVVEYSPPRADVVNAFRANSSGVSDEEGSYMMVEVTSTITSLGGANGRSVTVETRPSGGSWTSQEVYVSDGYEGFNSWTHGGYIWADTAISYEARVRVSDSFGNSSYYYATVSTASILINIRENKDGMAIGKMAEKAKTLQLGWDLELKGDPTADNHAANKKYVDTKAKRSLAHLYSNSGAISGNYYCKIKFNTSGNWFFMFSFTLRVYHGYRATDFLISGYHYGSNHWHAPSAVMLGDNSNDNMNVYFGYDSDGKLWLAFSAANYIGVDIFNFTNGYAQLPEESYEDLFTITLEGSLSGTTQATITAEPPYYRGQTVDNANNAAALALPRVDGVDALAYALALPEGSTTTVYFATGCTNLPISYMICRISRSAYGDCTITGTYVGNGNTFRNATSTNGASWTGWVMELDMGNVSDYPIASSTVSGTSHGWHYVKYNSGLAMCWGTTGICDTAFTATWGDWYIHDYLFPAQRFPFDFVEIPLVFASQGDSGAVACDWAIYSGGGATTQYTPLYSAFRPKTTGATVNLSLNLFAIGRWK